MVETLHAAASSSINPAHNVLKIRVMHNRRKYGQDENESYTIS